MQNKTYKVKLNISSEKLKGTFKRLAGIYRKVYNLGTDFQQQLVIEEVQSPKNQFTSGSNLLRALKNICKTCFPYISKIDQGIISAAAHASSKTFRLSFNYHVEDLHYLSRKKDRMKFKTESNIEIFEDYINLPGVGKVRLQEKGRIPAGAQVTNATFSNDGFGWFLTVETKEDHKRDTALTGKPLDFSFLPDHSLVINGVPTENIINSSSYRKIEKRYKKALKKLRRQKKMNLISLGSHRTSRNVQKTKKKLNRLNNKLYNIRKDSYAKVANNLAKTKPLGAKFLIVPQAPVRIAERDALGKFIGNKKLNRVRKIRKSLVVLRHLQSAILKKLELTGVNVQRCLSLEEFRGPGAQVFVEGRDRVARPEKQELS